MADSGVSAPPIAVLVGSVLVGRRQDRTQRAQSGDGAKSEILTHGKTVLKRLQGLFYNSKRTPIPRCYTSYALMRPGLIPPHEIPSIKLFPPPMPYPAPAVFMSNDGKQPYRCRVRTSTGYVAVMRDTKSIKIHPADGREDLIIPCSKQLILWPCNTTDRSDIVNSPTSVGQIQMLDCSRNQLCELDVRSLPSLKQLNCSHNRLDRLWLLGPEGSGLAGPSDLEVLDCSRNLLVNLYLSDLPHLEKVNCSRNRLKSIRLGPKLSQLKKLDCSNNRLSLINLAGLVALQHLNATANLLKPKIQRGENAGFSPVG